MTAVLGFIKEAYSSLPEINGATLSGAIDVLVIQQEDGSLRSSPWYLRIGKYKVLRNPRDRAIKITVNEQLVDFEMKLSSTGDAYFTEETDERPAEEDMTSPLLSPRSDMDLPDRMHLSPRNESDPDSRATSPDPAEAAEADMPAAASSSGKSWWGGSWSHKIVRKEEHKSEDDEATSELDVEEMLRRQMDADVRGDPSDGLLEPGGEREEGAGVLDVSAAAEAETEPEREGRVAEKDARAVQVAEQNLNLALNCDTACAEEPAQLAGETEPRTAASQAAARIKGQAALDAPPAAATALFTPGGDPDQDSAVIQGLQGNRGRRRKGGRGEMVPGEEGLHLWQGGEKQPVVEPLACGLDKVPELQQDGQGIGQQRARQQELSGDGGCGGGDGAGDAEESPCPAEAELSSVSHDPKRGVSWRLDEEEAATPGASEPVSLQLLSALLQWPDPLPPPPVEAVMTAASHAASAGASESLSPAQAAAAAALCDDLEAAATAIGSDENGSKEDEAGLAEVEAGGVGAAQMKLSLCGRILQERAGMTRREQMEVFERHLVSQEQFFLNPLDIASSPELYVSINGDIYRWQVMAPAVLAALVYRRQLPVEVHQELVTLDSRFAMFQSKRGEGDGEEGVDGAAEFFMRLCSEMDEEEDVWGGGGRRYIRKTNMPTQEQLLSLPLQSGANVLRFYLSSGAAPVTASIYLWSHKSKVVISDVDGTITKSDLMGHIAPAFGIQWAQKGVAQLLNKIEDNNYKVLYLTARPIGQADATKSYLKSVHENGVRLPVGPVITSPDGMFRSLHREVIMRKPEEFKIDCLQTIKRLFGDDALPFYAGFGNRHTDVTSYQAVEIPDSRIMIINPQGEVHNPLNGQARISSYDGLRELCDLMFPPVVESREVTDDKYNTYNFWQVPINPFEELNYVDPEQEKKEAK